MATKTAKASASTASWCMSTPCLLLVIAIQWILLSTLLLRKEFTGQEPSSRNHNHHAVPRNVDVTPSLASRLLEHNTVDDEDEDHDSNNNNSSKGGVAVTVIFKAPKWFHLRYKVMLDNALANVPNEHWTIQIFVNEPWVASQLLPWHPGLRRWLSPTTTATTTSSRPARGGRVTVTPLPYNLTSAGGAKPKDIVSSRWFWNSVQAEHVLLFSGNGAFCGNHESAYHTDHRDDSDSRIQQQPQQHQQNRSNRTTWSDLLDLDYCGTPWTHHEGTGGDGGSHSLRRRSAMLRVLDYADRNDLLPLHAPEHKHVLELMRKMNREQPPPQPQPFRVATVEQTMAFGGVYNLSTPDSVQHIPLVVAGTHARLTYAERDSLLKHCPELKVIFPSLHEPTCFGAHPKPESCRATICALQDNLPSHGC